MAGNSNKSQAYGLFCLLLIIGGAMGWTGYTHRQQDVRNTGLIDAAARNDLPKVVALLAEGANPNAMWRNKKPYSWQDFCKQMVGIDPRAGEGGHTALMLAAQDGQLPLAKALIDSGANVNMRDGEGSTALHWAARSTKPDSGAIILLLAANRADLKAKSMDGKTAVDLAARNPKNLEALQQAVKGK